MSDKTFVATIALAAAIAFGFMAQCQYRTEEARYRHETEIQKARIEKGLDK